MAQFRHVWMDTETSGWFKDGGVLIELAAVVCDKDHNVLDRFEVLVKLPEGAHWDDGAEQTHGITRERLAAEGEDRDEARTRFMTWLHAYGIGPQGDGQSPNRAMPCGQNIQFDLEFIRAFVGDDFGTHFGYHSIDTMHVAKFVNDTLIKMHGYNGAAFKVAGKPSASLLALRSTFGMMQEGAHRALKDVEDTLEVYKRTQGVLIQRMERGYQYKTLISALSQVADDPAALQTVVRGYLDAIGGAR